MTALVLVVDDRPTNVLLLETKLSNEYYNVVTAADGHEALRKISEHNPDLILLDVMMPGMDGFEVCRRLKADLETAHIPVIMVTALSSRSDRQRGLEAGADDFLTKPFNDIIFFARTKSLIRIKMLMDELRLRERTIAEIMGRNPLHEMQVSARGARVLVVDEDAVELENICVKLSEAYQVESALGYEAAMEKISSMPFDVVMVSAQMNETEGLRLASHLKSRAETRHIPLVIMIDESRTQTMLRALEFGINDYLLTPLDYNEMMARVRTQARRKRYQDMLLESYEQMNPEEIKDPVTGMYNRKFVDLHAEHLVEQSFRLAKPMTALLVDIDHFKPVNDTYGMGVGDQVLAGLSKVVVRSIRTADTAARFGGEELLILLPETDLLCASVVADRIRETVQNTPIRVEHDINALNVTVSIGAAQLQNGDSLQELLKRADQSLYTAKQEGRNRVKLAGKD